MKKSPKIWSKIAFVINILSIVSVGFFVYLLFINPSSGHGDGLAAVLLGGMICLPLYVIGLLVTFIAPRTRKNIILLAVPFLLIGTGVLYERLTHISYFNPEKYQYLVGKNISETTELYKQALSGTGQTEVDRRKGYTLPGMVMWVDENEVIISVESN